ncbi:hypothetical protein NLG97_g8070 [Lecanicillium saksenae]|uniref:Uncharacterized protein n=1 Tax=Lecanicillium saksenae TaxID=468837 RepID=A0ACC1QMJ3_9HYPO|nr:hypothetical protein NLG97_g8070 [Lecanicillium saksenae]
MADTAPQIQKNTLPLDNGEIEPLSHAGPSKSPGSDDAASTTSSSDGEPEKKPKQSKWKKAKVHLRHYRKYYALGVVLALAIILPLLLVKLAKRNFKVIIPLIIQRVINTRDIQVQHASVFIRSSTEIDFSANASLHSPLPASIGDLEFTLHDTETEKKPPAVLTADIDGFPIAKSTNIDIRKKTLHVNDPGALVSWANRFIDSDTIPFDVQVKKIDIFLGKLRYGSKVNRPITINGLRGLQDLTLEDVKLFMPAVENKNIRANITLSNPSSLSVQVGNVTVDLIVNDIKVGEALAYNVSLVPGLTRVYIDGQLDLPVIGKNLGSIIRQQAPQLPAGHITIQLRITSFNMHGEKIEFLDTLLSTRPLPLKVPLVALLNGAGTGILKSGLSGMGMANGTGMGEKTLVDAIGEVFSNKTLMGRIQGHWDRRLPRR